MPAVTVAPTEPESFETAKPVVLRAEKKARTERNGVITVQHAGGINGTDPEDYLIGACLLDEGATLDKAMASGLTTADLTNQRRITTYAALRHMRESGVPIGLDTLFTELGPRINEAGGLPELMAISDPLTLGTTLHADHYIRVILDRANRRRVILKAKDTIERAERGEELEVAKPARAAGEARPITSFTLPPAKDHSILIGKRWLCRGDGAILSSTSGMGKSTISAQLAMHWALDRQPFNAFKPNGSLTSLIFQSEDSEGDMAEIQLSICEGMKLTGQERATVGERVKIITDRVNRGPAFLKALKAQIELHKPDLVWINPILAFLGGDVNDAEEVGNFLRGGLNGLNEPATHAYIIIHHTAKPPKDKTDRKWNEMMYDMAGSADLTNWARAILSLRAGENEGEFNLVLAKRGVRAGATELKPGTVNTSIKFPTPTTIIPIRHSTQRFTPQGATEDMPMIYWEMMDKAVSEGAKSPAGRKKKYSVEDLQPCFPIGPEKALGFRALHNFAKEIKPTIGTGTFEDILLEAQEQGLIKVDKTNPRQPKYYSPRTPEARQETPELPAWDGDES